MLVSAGANLSYTETVYPATCKRPRSDGVEPSSVIETIRRIIVKQIAVISRSTFKRLRDEAVEHSSVIEAAGRYTLAGKQPEAKL